MNPGTMSITQSIAAFFDAEGWPYAPADDDSGLRLAFQGDSGQWLCYARAFEGRGQCAFYSLCPVRAPAELIGAAAELLARANYGLVLGNFELDYDDGEIRYKTSLDLGGGEPAEPAIRAMVFANVATMDRYLPAILAVLYGGADPQQAVEAVEAPARLRLVAQVEPAA
jgi:hypothetical protein